MIKKNFNQRKILNKHITGKETFTNIILLLIQVYKFTFLLIIAFYAYNNLIS
jgi:hypothetical protein